jgi:DNA-binding transcriptional LysR family regulator
MKLVSEGLGVALVPMMEAHLPLPPELRAISLGENTFYREIGMLRKAGGSRRPVVMALEKHLREAITPGRG